MNKLQLCQRVRQESGISGSGPVTTISQSGEMGKIVSWVDSAYEDIENLYTSWNFLRFDFSFQTIAAASTYTPIAVGLDELASWKQDSVRAYLTSSGIGAEQIIYPVSWDMMRDVRLLGAGATLQGNPSEFAIRPNKAMVLWPTPNAIYTVTGEYFKRAQSMTLNTDEPLIPVQFHMAIVWKAVMYYAADQGAAELYAVAGREYARIMRGLKKDQLPVICMGGPLA